MNRQRLSGFWRISAGMLAMLLSQAAQAESHLRFGGALNAGYDSNSNNAIDGSQKFDSAFLSGDAGVEHATRFTPASALITKVMLGGEIYERHDGLNNAKLTGLLRFRHQLGNAGTTLNLWGSAAWWEFDNRLRDSAEYRVGAFLQQPLDPALSLRMSVSASERTADNNAVFDLSARAVGLQLDWEIASLLTFYGEYQFRVGDVVSSSAPSPVLRDLAAVRAPDDAYAERNADMIAYRLDADTHVLALGFNYGLGPNLSLDGRVQGIYSDAEANLEYTRYLSMLSLLARF